jgi:hypothetical protein
LRELKALGVAEKASVLRSVQDALQVSDAHVNAWAMQDGFAPPKEPKPTIDQCRQALAA